MRAELLVGVLCAIFGLGAGALYGLWAGRAVSRARRLKRVRAASPRPTPRSLSPGPEAPRTSDAI